MTTPKKPLPAVYTTVFAAGAMAFLVLLAADATGIGRTVAKAVPVTTLLVLVLREVKGFARICLSLALLGCVCGDILLDLSLSNLFIFGLVAFLSGHIFYAVLFFRHARKPDRFAMSAIAGLIVFAGAMMWLFSGIEPDLYGPVVAYIIVIVAMSIGALLVPAQSLLLFWGALLFIASDVVLAVNKFLAPIPHGRLINISIYFLAQYVIIAAARSIWAAKTDSQPKATL